MSVPMATSQVTKLLAASKLPSFPAVAVRLMELLSQENANFPRIWELLETDAALSTEVLRLANSPLFCVRAEIKTIPAALAALGLDRLSVLVVTSALWRSIPGGVSRQLVRTWWRHNLACALLSSHLYAGDAQTDYSYVAGLLHSVGQLALIGAYPVEYCELQVRADAEGRSLLECEREFVGIDHCELGHELLTSWGLPFEVAEAAAYHHQPENAESPFPRFVHLACHTATQWGFAVSANQHSSEGEYAEQIRKLVDDAALCESIAKKMNSIEARLL